jgi:hypothetical protein
MLLIPFGSKTYGALGPERPLQRHIHALIKSPAVAVDDDRE